MTTPFQIVESTLREGEQFYGAHFNSDQKILIAEMLDAFGVEFIELTSPAASPQSYRDAARIAGLGLRAKVLTHTRCHMDDVKQAIDAGVDGVNVLFATSAQLRRCGHGKSIAEIIETALRVIDYVKSQGVQIRFSTEDSFRSDLVDLLSIYRAVDAIGVDRVGVADTVGIATPEQVKRLVGTLRGVISCGIEFHCHNDTGCAIANALSAVEAGANLIDTTVLGIGERNGITPLGGFVARMYSLDRETVMGKYELKMLPRIERTIAEMVGIDVPFSNIVTGSNSFCHKAGMHTKAILNDPGSYEVLRPEDFGVNRQIHINHRLTGWNAIRHRVRQLNLNLDDQAVKAATAFIKAGADDGPLSMDEVDHLLRAWPVSGGVGEQALSPATMV